MQKLRLFYKSLYISGFLQKDTSIVFKRISEISQNFPPIFSKRFPAIFSKISRLIFYLPSFLRLGISVCGSGVGTFIFAPLASYLVETFGWKGANLIFAALCLQCAVRS
jgi:hypothetical protein